MSGEVVGERTVRARIAGFEELVCWTRSLDRERLWAIEDCRHVSGAFERFLLKRGERVVRVPPRLMGEARRGQRTLGKSDAIDAQAVARAALRDPDMPTARLAGPEREIRLLVDHREDLVAERTRIQQRLRWHLHELDPDLELPARALDRRCWLDRIDHRLAQLEPTTLTRVSQELLSRCLELTSRVNELKHELTELVTAQAAPLLALPGCGPLTAAKLLAEIAGINRFTSDAKLAKHIGAAPLPASSGNTNRHRLNRHGNRQLNCALHRIAITQARTHQPARAYIGVGVGVDPVWLTS